ncbi:hypothetical protein ACIQF5_21780 [Streptomyces goshikiensis]|uniref:hypothetical protein n=1 Tax=Streptomyces goshikiensis TaxID=1942 RepID=UPI003821B31B
MGGRTAGDDDQSCLVGVGQAQRLVDEAAAWDRVIVVGGEVPGLPPEVSGVGE